MSQLQHQTRNSNVVLEGVSWDSYEGLLDMVGDGHIRFTYDDGRLEIMSPSGIHELAKAIIRRIIETYAEETKILVQCYGSTTFKNRRRRKGLEPDECYYVQHFSDVVGKGNLDLETDPPPDLAVEVDITSASVPRQPIYAAMGVAEIWRYDGIEVTSLHFKKGKGYVESSNSLAFPKLPMTVVSRLVQISQSSSQPAAVGAMGDWVRTGERP